MTHYELWDIDTGNRIGGYNSKIAAKRDVRRDITKYGGDSPLVLSMVLVRLDSDGSRMPVHEADDLVRWALSEKMAEPVSPQTPPRGLDPEETER